MDYLEAARLLREALQGRAVAEGEMVDAQVRMEGLGQVVVGVLRAFPDLRNALDESDREVVEQIIGSRPKGSEAVRAILESERDRAFSVATMVFELKERDWLPASDNPTNAVRTALERLCVGEDSAYGKARWPEGVVYFSKKGYWGSSAPKGAP